MEQDRISELLQPFVDPQEGRDALSAEQLCLISTYLEILLRWNARINLTAIRDAEGIVTRHFGESLFLAAHLFAGQPAAVSESGERPKHALDLGSGAGFPGLPLKIYAPRLRLTLVESNRRKAAFLGEAIRALQLRDVSVFSGRLEASLDEQAAGAGLFAGIEPADVVTMRAVERFESALATASALIRCSAARVGAGKLALLIGLSQARQVPHLVADFSWEPPFLIPHSRERVLLVGRYLGEHVSNK